MESIKLTIAEQIDRALQGRSQRWIIGQMVAEKHEISEVQFSNKKRGFNGAKFTEPELTALSRILGVELSQD